MLHVRDEDQPVETWRPGVETRMFVSQQTGAAQLTMFEQWCAPGHGAPAHVHAVEEVLRILAGTARIAVDAQEVVAGAGESVIIRAGVNHGFVNVGNDVLHTLAVLAAPVFEASYVESGEASRRWNAP